MERNFLFSLLFLILPLSSMANQNKIGFKYKKLVEVSRFPTVDKTCWQDEIQFEEVAQQIVNPLIFAMEARKADSFQKTLDTSITLDSFEKMSVEKTTSVASDLEMINKKSALKITGPQAFVKDLNAYLQTFKKIDQTEINVIANEKQAEGSYFLRANYSTKGLDRSGQKREDRGLFSMAVKKVGKAWKLEKLETSQFFTLSGRHEPAFKLASAPAVPSYQRLEAIRRGGYALAIGDYDNDGNQDMLVGAYGPLTLLKGKGDGSFTPVKNSGIDALDLVKSAVWADFNNDGMQDLLLVRFVEYTPEELTQHQPPKRQDLNFESHDFGAKTAMTALVVYQNLGNGKFKKSSEIRDTEMVEKAMPTAVADFNGDGLLDIYVGYPGVKDFTTLSNDVQKKIGKKIQGLFMNKGDFSFAEKDLVGPSNRLFSTFSRENLLYPHSAVAADFDQDGKMDIAVIDDRGNLSPIYKNDGKGQFSEVSQKLGIDNEGFGMGLAIADINNDGRLDVAISNVVFNVDHRVDNCVKTKAPQLGIRLFSSTEKGFKDTTIDMGLQFPGEALGGIEFIDYDGDGKSDIYVTNGLWSGNQRGFELTSPVKRVLNATFERTLVEEPSHTKSYVMELLAEYKNKAGKYPSMGGFQRNRLYKNLGNGKFLDVGYFENVDSIHDGYMVARADLNNDGRADLILRNADPGTKAVHYPPVEVYLASKTQKSQVLAIKLKATGSNIEAIGSEVVVEVEGQTNQTQQLIANNGTVQSERLLFFSLGDQKRAKQVRVKWPNGNTEVFSNVGAGKQVLVEGTSTQRAVHNDN